MIASLRLWLAMISRRQYIEALAHPDFFVRSGVFHMFSEDSDPECDVTAAVTASLDAFGLHEAFEWPHMVGELAMDETAAEWALRQIRDSQCVGESLTSHFLKWVCSKAPISVLRRMIPDLDAAAKRVGIDFPQAAAMAEGRRRLDLEGRTSGECLDLLLQTLESCNESEDFPHDSIRQAESICRRLAHADDMREDLVRLAMEWLAFDFSGEFSPQYWRSGVAIHLAGCLRIDQAIPRLLAHFDYDWDWWNESIQKAVKQMKTQPALETCAEIYPSLDWHGRLYLSDVFETARFPAMEKTVGKLLEEEPDDDLRVNLAAALALFATPQAQHTARTVLREFPQDPERFIIAETLYYQFILQGIEDPDLAKWRRKMEEMQTRRASRMSLLFGQDTPSAPSPLGLATATPRKPIRVGVSPGRNDPCPCGSGKKFKKCCLK
jgi:hypothetical protein